ncbi:MAG: extracellular solute-binding protein [Inquilinaceae bacterium]
MTHSRRAAAAGLAAVFWLAGGVSHAQETGPQHGIAMHGAPALDADATHQRYANPDAPKGGRLSRAVSGSFDSLNPFIVQGTPGAGVAEYHFPTLMSRSWDEPFTLYGYVAQTIETPPDRSSVTFEVHPDARFHDDTPITVDDVVFSMETLREKGTPGQRRNYGRIARVERLDARTVRFVFNDEADRETPLIIGLMPVLSKAYYTDHPFDQTSLEIPLGGGPYRIASVDPGRSIRYERVEDWWGEDLPAFRGHNNFDRLDFEYYRDGAIELEAFKAGEYNYRLEFNPDRWATGYDFPAARDGRVTLMIAPHSRPLGMRAFAFNTRRDLFQDIRVRQAVGLAFDFEWVNRNYLRGAYKRTDSYFVNSELAARGVPEGAELALLEPFRDRLPETLFTTPFAVPESDGSGNIRGNLREASRLLEESGWVVRDGARVNAETGQPFAFEILLNSASDERVALALAENLSRLGIEAEVRTVDSAQYTGRSDNYDFDMIIHWWRESLSPGAEQNFYWGSTSADTPGTRNYAGIKDPVVDALAAQVADAEDRDALVTAVRALDRVLLHGHYVIPLYHTDVDRIAYWGNLGFVDTVPLYGQISTVNAWWQEP